MKLIKVIGILLFCPFVSFSQTSSDWTKDVAIVEAFFKEYNPIYEENSMIQAASYLINTPYVAATLEGNNEEQLVVNLRELDCMTFVENCLALNRALQYSHPDMEYFSRELKRIRYREGRIDGYTSRLHYTSDWITDNVGKGILEDMTHALGGHKFQVHVSYMSTHPESYPALKDNRQDVAVMRQIESAINTRNNYFYIPKQEIRDKQSMIKNGDIVCFTTSITGLDISHLGIAYWQRGELTFIHASSKAKKVIVNTESLADYCLINKSNTGIMVLRPLQIAQEQQIPIPIEENELLLEE